MADQMEKRQGVYVPPEIWQRIFFQHTHPSTLWTAGRQVCSMWRSGIPKVFAKKYLENPDMVQIYFDLGTERIEGWNCQMGAEMVFNRYEGKDNNRCVFKEHTSTGTRNSNSGEDFNKRYEAVKFGTWRSNLSLYLGADPGSRRDGGRFDLPPYQIRIKSAANDTELSNLAYDYEKREISFEWEGMFARFFHEAEVLVERERKSMTEAEQWLSGGETSIVGALALSKRNKEASRSRRKEIRRDRVKKWYMENHKWEYPDSLFEEGEEDKALDAIGRFEMNGDFTRCAEDTESRQQAESHAESQGLMEMMNSIREMKGVREDDENGLMAMFMEFMGAGGPPGGGGADDDIMSEEWSEDDEDMDEGDGNMGESNGTRLA